MIIHISGNMIEMPKPGSEATGADKGSGVNAMKLSG